MTRHFHSVALDYDNSEMQLCTLGAASKERGKWYWSLLKLGNCNKQEKAKVNEEWVGWSLAHKIFRELRFPKQYFHFLAVLILVDLLFSPSCLLCARKSPKPFSCFNHLAADNLLLMSFCGGSMDVYKLVSYRKNVPGSRLEPYCWVHFYVLQREAHRLAAGPYSLGQSLQSWKRCSMHSTSTTCMNERNSRAKIGLTIVLLPLSFFPPSETLWEAEVQPSCTV